MIITARATHISHSPRKVNLVTKSIVGLPAAKALEKLGFTIKRASSPVAKVLRQAIANATNNLKLPANSLFVDTAFATKGRTIKRGHFGGHMRYKPYEKIASHLTINLRSVAPKVAATKKLSSPNASNSSNSTHKSNIKPKTK